jgi:hypothetical protein
VRVLDVAFHRDRRTGRHSGLAYVELGAVAAVPYALMLNGQVPDWQGFPIAVRAVQAERIFEGRQQKQQKEQQKGQQQQQQQQKVATVTTMTAAAAATAAATAAAVAAARGAEAPRVVLASNIDAGLTRDALLGIFAPFGKVVDIQLLPPPPPPPLQAGAIRQGRGAAAAGSAWVTFETAAYAALAAAKVNGMSVAHKVVSCSVGQAPAGTAAAAAAAGSTAARRAYAACVRASGGRHWCRGERAGGELARQCRVSAPDFLAKDGVAL